MAIACLGSFGETAETKRRWRSNLFLSMAGRKKPG